MKAKHYTLLWLLFSLGLGIYAHNLNPDVYTLTPPLLNSSLSLPVALWVIMPLFLFFIVSLVWLIASKTRGYLEARHQKRDYELLIQQILAQAMEKEFKGSFKTEKFAHLSQILRRFSLYAKPNTTLSDEESVDAFIEASYQIAQGELVDLKRFHLPYTAPLSLAKERLRLKDDTKAAVEILKKGEAPDSLKKSALLAIFERGEEKEIRKFQNALPLDRELLLALLNAYKAKRITLSFEEIATLCEQARFEARDFLLLARELQGALTPDNWLRLFEVLQERIEAALEAYLYVLLELEMIEEAREKLGALGAQDLPKARAFLELRKAGFSYPAEIFFF